MPSSACSSQLSHTGLFLIAVASSALTATGLEFGIHQSGELTCGTAQLFCLPHAAGSGINSQSLLCYSEGDSREFLQCETASPLSCRNKCRPDIYFCCLQSAYCNILEVFGGFFVAMIAVA